MSKTKLLMIIAVSLVIQIVFFAFGFYVFMLPGAIEKATGVLIMVSNLVFGIINVSMLLDI